MGRRVLVKFSDGSETELSAAKMVRRYRPSRVQWTFIAAGKLRPGMRVQIVPSEQDVWLAVVSVAVLPG